MLQHWVTYLTTVISFSFRKFEGWLHSLDPGYGVRHLEKVTELAEQQGLALVDTVEMPANNLSVIYQKL